jgi:hypothetical protein
MSFMGMKLLAIGAAQQHQSHPQVSPKHSNEQTRGRRSLSTAHTRTQPSCWCSFSFWLNYLAL